MSTEAVRVAPGALALVNGWGGLEFVAKVERVEPAGFMKVSALGIEEQRVKVVLSLPANAHFSRRLGHEYRVFVHIIVEDLPDALRVPIGALFRQGDAWVVFTVHNGRARVTPVQLGARNAHYAQVVSGIEGGRASSFTRVIAWRTALVSSNGIDRVLGPDLLLASLVKLPGLTTINGAWAGGA